MANFTLLSRNFYSFKKPNQNFILIFLIEIDGIKVLILSFSFSLTLLAQYFINTNFISFLSNLKVPEEMRKVSCFVIIDIRVSERF